MSDSMFVNRVWLDALRSAIEHGRPVRPRGQPTLELPQHTTAVNMRFPVLTVAARKLSYKFMAAEAYWILTGDNRVSSIAPYNKHIADFSDDGIRFFGAYGPRIIDQLPYVTAKLVEDPSTREAGLTIWRPSPPPTKDVPCTVAIFFELRQSDPGSVGNAGTSLNCHVFMRSSDLWLGWPYDVFNFSMLSNLVCCELRGRLPFDAWPGTLYLTAASMHLYERNMAAAKSLVSGLGDLDTAYPAMSQATPPAFSRESPKLLEALARIRLGGDAAGWWTP